MVHAAQTGTNKSIGRIILQGISILVVVLIALFSLKFAVVEQLAQSKSDYLDMSSEFQTDPDILVELARREHITGDLDKAHLLYLRALDSFVLHAPSWLGLAEVLYDLGKKDQAAAALQALDNLQLDNIDLIWNKAQLAHTLHREKILLKALTWLAENDRLHRKKVFNFAGESWDDPLFLLSNFKTSHYPDILQHYIRTNQAKKAQTVWHEFDKSGFKSPETTIAYVSLLLKNKEFDLAVAAWETTFQENGSLLHNGNFENPLLNSAFGWQASETKGVSFQHEDFGGGLTISFDGTENVAFMLSQIVPLYPGEHIFRGFFETTDLTSQQRPYWLISGYNCQGLHIEDSMLPPSGYTTEFAIAFAVPDSCTSVKIDLIRNRANTYDSLISGSLTLKKLGIERISPLPPEHAKSEKTLVKPVISPVQEPTTEFIAKSEVEKAPVANTELFEQNANNKEPDTTEEVLKPTTIKINSLIIRF